MTHRHERASTRRAGPAARLALGLSLCAALAACRDGAERAEDFFRAGIELREAGDPERAALEFRNVFRFDGAHYEARLALAEILREAGGFEGAYGQYLRLAEQYPENLQVRGALASMALEARAWEDAERHGRPVIAADPGAPAARAIAVALGYRDALAERDASARATRAAEARTLLGERPDDIVLWRISIDEAVGTGAIRDALPSIDAALAVRPLDLELSTLKLRLLDQLGETGLAEAHLDAMAVLFDGDPEIGRMAVGWHLRQGQTERALEALRAVAGPEAGPEAGPPEAQMEVISFLREIRGEEAGAAELDRLIALNEGDAEARDFFRSVRAAGRFDAGARAQAVAEMRALVESAAGGEGAVRLETILAEMLRLSGEAGEAMALAERVLEREPGNVEALKTRGSLLIEADRPDEAVLELRRALDQAPLDAGILMRLSRAHARAGNAELMGETLAAAVRVSGSGVEESLAYAAALAAQGRIAPARAVLAEARAAHPLSLDLLAEVARTALADGALGTAHGVLSDLDAMEEAGAAQDLAATLRASLALRDDRRDEAIEILVAEGEDAGTVLAVVRARIAEGRTDEARTYLAELRARLPQDARLGIIDAGLMAAEGDADGSESLLRDIAGAPGAEMADAATQLLYGQLSASGRGAEALALVDEALQARPGSRALRFVHASALEAALRTDEAIAIYEALYTEDSSDPVVANNLASLLATHREDAQSLERAARLARRFRGTRVPALQDTYGWIAHRQGRRQEALAYLEPAAAAMPLDAAVQAHLGAAYAADGQDVRAAAAFRRVLDLAGEADVPHARAARAALAAMEQKAGAGPGVAQIRQPGSLAGE